jgi:hypothetical protein
MVRGGSDGLHIQHLAGAIIDMGQGDDGDLIRDRPRDVFLRHGTDLVARPQHRDQPFGDIDVGRKIARLGQDQLAVPAQRAGGGEQLEQVDRSRIRGDHFAGRGPDDPRDLVADALRQIHPAMVVPAGDQRLAPFFAGDVDQPREGPARQGAKGISVEIDAPLGQLELIAERAERVLAVEG